MLVGIIGDFGSGKTLLMCIFSFYSNRKVLANFEIINNHKYTKLELTGLLNLPKNRDIFIDEAYTWLESRTSMSKINQFISYIIFQSRHIKIDLYITAQLFNSIDLRFRNNANIIINCTSIRIKNKILGFRYDFYKVDRKKLKYITSLLLKYEKAKQFFNNYDTYELIKSKDYISLKLELLLNDINALKKELKVILNDISKEMKKDKIKFNKTNLEAYMSIYRIPKKFSPYLYKQLEQLC